LSNAHPPPVPPAVSPSAPEAREGDMAAERNKESKDRNLAIQGYQQDR